MAQSIKTRTVVPPAFASASEVDPSELPDRLRRLQEYLLDAVEYDCRHFAKTITEWKNNNLWQYFSPSWEEFVSEHVKQPIEWIDHMILGVNLLDRSKPIKAKDAVNAAKKMAVIEAATKADPTVERKPGAKEGEVRNPEGLGGKSGKQFDNPYHDKGYQKSSVYGSSLDYLVQRIAETSPDIHEKLKAGEYPSVRKAAIEAGIVKPRQTVSWNESTTPEDFASRLYEKMEPDFLVQVVAALTDVLTNQGDGNA